MKTYGLVGFPISHSFSRNYFEEKFKQQNITDCEFVNFRMENIRDFPNLIKTNPHLRGLSITIPHKQSVIQFLDRVDETAKQIGAVNCIRVSRQSSVVRLNGFNTDVFGFERSLKPLLKPHHTHTLILGTGGASKAVAYVLDKSKIKFSVVSRYKGDFSYSALSRSVMKENTLIINTTPLGMFPNVNECPDIPYKHLTSKHLLYDLTYNPEETLFLKKGKEMGAEIKNGLEMLHLQAEEAWRIWNS